MLGVGKFYLWLFSFQFTINSGFSADQIQLVSPYNGSSRTAKLGSSFDFSWNYTGNLRRVEWGTKEAGITSSKNTLFIVDVHGIAKPTVPQFYGRHFGSWNQQSPGQVKFTLNPIKEVDNQTFIFKFVPMDLLTPSKYDVVQLIVKGPPVVEIIPPVLLTLRGVTASFTCNAEGFPLPNIVWMKQTSLGESEISASSVNIQINSHNGSSQLIVQSTSATDSGHYICKASNYISDTATAFLGVVYPASYEDADLCPISFDATIDEAVLMCCPVKGFPPPQVSWELPNGTLLETGSTILHVTVKTENDFGRYRCIARSLEKNVLTANITIRKRISELDINDTKIVLTDGDKFVWEEVEGVGDYLLRLLESNFSKENSLLGCGTSTSVEIPYSSLPFKSDTKKRPLKVVIEVWAIGYSSVTVKGTRYTNVEIRAGATIPTVSLMTILLSFVIWN